MLTFLIFVALMVHVIIAHITHALLEDVDSNGWYKSKYKKYLLRPGLPEVVLAILLLMICGVLTYTYIISLFED
jgi:predicted MFS family arabinose efflux permease